MKVKIFVNWSRRVIMNQKEGEAEFASYLNDKIRYEEYRSTYLDDIIKEWLDDKKEVHISEYYKKIFELSAEERAEIETKFRESYEENVKEEFSDDWDEVEIEI